MRHPIFVVSFSVLVFGLVLCRSHGAFGEEYQNFVSIAGGSSGTAGWDNFQDPFHGPHQADKGFSGFNSPTLTVNNNDATGLVTTGNDLYSFFSTPVWNIQMNGMNSSDPFTSIAIQFAITPDQFGNGLDQSDFLLDSAAPDQFVDLGQQGTLSAGGGQPPQPVNYYWAAWDGRVAGSGYLLQVGPPGANHTVLAGVRIDYVNTSTANYQITAVPEPATAGWSLATILVALYRRKR